jgi:hypothetical protein
MIVRTKPIDAFQANRGVGEGRAFGAAGDDANGLSHSRTLDYRLGSLIGFENKVADRFRAGREETYLGMTRVQSEDVVRRTTAFKTASPLGRGREVYAQK